MEPGYEYSIAETLLQVQGVEVTYGENVILRDVNLKIDNIVRPNLTQGQVNSLLAPSGMGKTQLFRCIAALQKPTQGTVFLNRHDQKDEQGVDILREVTVGSVGVVAQDYPLFDHLTVWDNLMASALLRQKDRKKAAETVTELLERFGLMDRRANYPHQLSGGQRQRVAIIQQMVCSGKLLLMDEPFSGLDILMKTQVENLITSVAAQDELNSVILTTHDIQSAIAVSDTIILLGRDRDVHGNVIPGAKVKHTYNLMDLGLTWRPNVSELPAFAELEREIKGRFKEL